MSRLDGQITEASKLLEYVLIFQYELLSTFVDNWLLDVFHASEAAIEELEVVVDHWLIGRDKLLFEEFLNVQRSEEGMLKNLRHIPCSAKTLSFVFLKQLLDDVTSHGWHFNAEFGGVRESDWAFLDQILHPVLVTMEERSDADYEFIKEDAYCPPVNSVIVTVADDHLWWQVLRCATEWVWLIFFAGSHFCKAEICQKKIPVFIEKNVFRLQITVQDIFLVQMANSKDNLSNEEFCLLLWESFHLVQMTEKLSSLNEVH